jgi:hypothetical protein
VIGKFTYFNKKSNGIVAFFEPGLMNKKVFFYISSHGYQFPKDGFGFEGTTVFTKPKEKTSLEMKRINKAERLYRSSGYGIYRDSVLVSEKVPIQEPLLNTNILGLDSVLTSIYKGKIFWFWGDTLRPEYPLGNFHVTGATSNLPKESEIDIEYGINYKYFSNDDNFVKSVAMIEPKAQPTWIHATVVLKEKNQEILLAGFHKPETNQLPSRDGFIQWNDQKEEFELLTFFKEENVSPPIGSHTVKGIENNVEFIYFSDPYPMVKVEATFEKFINPKEYFAFTCLKEGTNLKDWNNVQLDRDQSGTLKYSWKKNTSPISTMQYHELIARNFIKKEEAYFLQLKDLNQRFVTLHRGTVKFNAFKNKYILVGTEFGGETSQIGEIWYSEANTIVGPWRWAVKIMTHDHIDFYNPAHHEVFDKMNGKTIFIEGTYTRTFDLKGIPTPMYEYNQQFYKLNLDSVQIPQPIYLHENGTLTTIQTSKLLFYSFIEKSKEVELVPVIYEKKKYVERKNIQPEDIVVFYSLKEKSTSSLDYFVHENNGVISYSLKKSPIFAFRVFSL